MDKRPLVPPPVSETVHCRHCGANHQVFVIAGLGQALTHSPKICSKCGQPLPNPSSSLFDRYRRQQSPQKRS